MENTYQTGCLPGGAFPRTGLGITKRPVIQGRASVLDIDPVFKIKYICFGYFDPQNILQDNENTYILELPNQWFGLKSFTDVERCRYYLDRE